MKWFLTLPQYAAEEKGGYFHHFRFFFNCLSFSSLCCCCFCYCFLLLLFGYVFNMYTVFKHTRIYHVKKIAIYIYIYILIYFLLIF